MNVYFIITKGNYISIDADDSACHGYYIIILYSYPYTLQEGLYIDGEVICFGEMVLEGTYYFPININYRYYVSPKINKITRIYL